MLEKKVDRVLALKTGMAVLLILLFARRADFRMSEIAACNMIFDHREKRQDWW